MKRILLHLGIISLLVASVFTSNTCTLHAAETNITWESTLYCNESSGTIDYVVFGEAPDANDGPPTDTYDVAKPPTPIAPYIRASFKDNLPTPYSSLWKDYRQYPDTFKVWNLSVQWVPLDGESPSDITITWNPILIDSSEYTSLNLCTNTGMPLKNMLTENSYAFTCPAYAIQNFKIIGEHDNAPPGQPSTPNGETIGYHGTSYTYTTSSTDPDNDNVYYQFDWNNGFISNWFGPYPSGQTIQASFIWNTPGAYQVITRSKDINDQQSAWSSSLSVDMQNRVPAQPTNPSPPNRASNIQINPVLTWAGIDPDGDIISSTVYFSTTNPPGKIVENQSSSSFHPGTLLYQTTYYWKIISWDSFGGDTSSPVWFFTTLPSDDGSVPPDNDTNQTNQPPIADASLSEQTGFVGALLVFNASRSYDTDGYLTRWSWEFGDGTNGTGERTIHAYHALGIYMVTLTVTDDTGATGTNTISVEVGTANWPPTKPAINGSRTGTKNKTYAYALYATDADNDFLQYSIHWGDGTQNTSMFLPNGTTWSLSHSWNTSGKYQIIAKVEDNITSSEDTTIDVFIDVFFVNTLGFLYDANNDGQYDSLYINNTMTVTVAQKLTNGSYYLDTNNDGKWDYNYNPSTGSLTPLSTTITTIENQWFFILIIAIAIIIIACIVYLYKKNYF